MEIRLDGTNAMRDARKITTETDRQKGRRDYAYVNSTLDTTDEFGDWVEGSFFNTFHKTIEEYDSLQEYIENILKEKKGEAVGIEFGGLGINLFKSFTPGFFKQSIGVSLSDYRTEDGSLAGASCKEYKDSRKHDIIIGNIFDKDIYEKINKIIENKKVDFIIERMYGGLDNVPENYLIVMAILQKWYEMLNQGGVMFVEMPPFTIRVIQDWVALLQKSTYKNELDVQFDEFRNALRIRKISNTLKQLPKLKLQEIKKAYNIKSKTYE
jgi:hypothetical protein